MRVLSITAVQAHKPWEALPRERARTTVVQATSGQHSHAGAQLPMSMGGFARSLPGPRSCRRSTAQVAKKLTIGWPCRCTWPASVRRDRCNRSCIAGASLCFLVARAQRCLCATFAGQAPSAEAELCICVRSGSVALALGVESGPAMTPECAAVKMMLCLAHPNIPLGVPIAGEM